MGLLKKNKPSDIDNCDSNNVNYTLRANIGYDDQPIWVENGIGYVDINTANDLANAFKKTCSVDVEWWLFANEAFTGRKYVSKSVNTPLISKPKKGLFVTIDIWGYTNSDIEVLRDNLSMMNLDENRHEEFGCIGSISVSSSGDEHDFGSDINISYHCQKHVIVDLHGIAYESKSDKDAMSHFISQTQKGTLREKAVRTAFDNPNNIYLCVKVEQDEYENIIDRLASFEPIGNLFIAIPHPTNGESWVIGQARVLLGAMADDVAYSLFKVLYSGTSLATPVPRRFIT